MKRKTTRAIMEEWRTNPKSFFSLRDVYARSGGVYDYKTIRTWALVGVKTCRYSSCSRVRLETFRFGGVLKTTSAAIERFENLMNGCDT